MILFTKRASNIYLIPKSKMKEIILKEMHNSPLARHPGYLKTYKQIRECFSWKGLKNDVLWMGILYLLKKKIWAHPTYGNYETIANPWPKVGKYFNRFYHWVTQILGEGLHYFIINNLTKYAHLFSIFIRYQASQVAKIFFCEFFH